MRAASSVFTLCIILCLRLEGLAQEVPYKIRIDVVERTAKAINYGHRSGATKIDFRGTAIQPGSRGEAKVESKQGYTEIEVEFDDMFPAGRFGAEYLTYVMWAITPQGRATNLGEVVLNGTKSKLNVTTELQVFGMVVTAEPYFAVTQPSEKVVLENHPRRNTRGDVEEITARFESLGKEHFSYDRMPADRKPPRLDAALPVYLQQARNALRIAEWSGAERYAPDTLAYTRELVATAEDYFVRDVGLKPMSIVARQAAQSAEDARLIAFTRLRENELTGAREKAAGADRERAEVRQRLVEQLNRDVDVRTTAHGLVLNASENLFQHGRATLKPDGREKLARVAGLILSHPDLRLQVQASGRHSRSLARKRTATIRDFLVQQGLSAGLVSERSYGRGNDNH